ncbi:MAG: inositol monophosphatase family protein [Peptococcales bacterium]|jgi:myo-inositol-1(or 4)-monophosphatase
MQELDTLINICNEVSVYIQKNYYNAQAKFLKQYSYQNVSGDLQKGIDDIVNAKIIDLIKAAGLPVIIISEETGIIELSPNPSHFLLLDPIDGSNNVRPWFTPAPNLVISMGMGNITELASQGLDAIEVSIVKEIFSTNIYYSIKKQGAFYRNNQMEHKLLVSTLKSLESPVIGLDLDKKDSFEDNLPKFISQKILVRRLGSTILDLCQVASGQYDAYLSLGKRLKVTDVCQPYALITAAGGYMEIIPYYKNELYSGNFLYKCIKDQSLLLDIRFKIIAAGTKELLQEIKNWLVVSG